MTFNEFQRELLKRGIPENVSFMMATMFEKFIHLENLVKENGEVTLALANSVQGLVGLHERTQEGVQKLMRQGRPEGVEVDSVVNDPDEKKH